MFHILLCEFLFFLLCHTGTSVHLLPPLPGYSYASFFLTGPGPPHEIAVSAFSRSILGGGNMYLSLSLLLTPRISPSVPPISPCFLALAFPFFLSFSYFCLVPPKLLYGRHLFMASSYILPYLLDHAIPPYSSSLCSYFSHAALPTMADSFSCGMFLTLDYQSNFLMSLFCLGWIPSQFCSSYILGFLVVLERSSIFELVSSVMFLTVSRISRSLPMLLLHILALVLSTFIRIHLLILLPMCESVRIASILPTCALPFPIIFAMCVSQKQSFQISTPRYAY